MSTIRSKGSHYHWDSFDPKSPGANAIKLDEYLTQILEEVKK